MDLIWSNLRLSIEEDESNLLDYMARKLKVPRQSISSLVILRRSLDARKKPQLFFVYTLRFSLELPYKEVSRVLRRVPDVKPAPPEKAALVFAPEKKLTHRPIVVGSGPAGYFAALTLAQKGYEPIVFERGEDVETRTQRVEEFWETGKLDLESNVQFGEGGAGTFSDGKLTTRISDPRISTVLDAFVEQGAPAEIRYLAKAHIGTDILKIVTQGLRKKNPVLRGRNTFSDESNGYMPSEGENYRGGNQS